MRGKENNPPHQSVVLVKPQKCAPRRKQNAVSVKQPSKLPKSARIPNSSRSSQKNSLFLAFPKPSTGQFILENYPSYLTFLEEKEISNYLEIYYLRRIPPRSRSSNAIVPQCFQFVSKEHIAFRFEMIELLGKGSFGGVIKCHDHKTDQDVAIKFLRNHERHHEQILSELYFLQKLQDHNGPEQNHIIKYYGHFEFRGFTCFIEELLDLDLYKFLQRNHFQGMRVSMAQVIARGLAASLRFLHSQDVVHCDVKPENILFTSKRHISVKLIDFGCSCPNGENPFSYIQSRYYRAPEVVLGLKYGPAIDVWGFACVLFEILTGKVLFEGEDECDLMQLHMRLLGIPPLDIIEQGERSDYYFDGDGEPILRPNDRGEVKVPSSLNFSEILECNDEKLLSLLEGCLKWRSSERLTPEEIMSHPWLCGSSHAEKEFPIQPPTNPKKVITRT